MTTTIPSQTVTRTPPRFVLTPKLKTAITMTALTLLGLITGLLGEHTLDNEYVKWGGYALAYLAGGIPAGREALHSLFVERKLDVDLLMVLAALGAASIGQAADGAILLFLFSLSNTLQDWAMGRTKNAIQALMDLNPEGATVRRDGVEKWCELGDIRIGDLLVVKPGERIAADARVVKGNTSVDESPITGESVPIDKTLGSELASGTVNLNGSVEAEVVRPAGESTLARLVGLMEEAQTQKSKTEHITEKYESPYAMIVLLCVPLVYALLRYGFQLNNADSWYRARHDLHGGRQPLRRGDQHARRDALGHGRRRPRRGSVQEQRRAGHPGRREHHRLRQDRHAHPGENDPDAHHRRR